MGSAGFNRHLLIGVEGTWGVGISPTLAAPLAGGRADFAGQNDYYEPDSNLGGFETVQVNQRQIVRGGFSAMLHKDAGLAALQMGIVRRTTGAGLGNLDSYTLALMSPAGGRKVVGAMSESMELSVDRNGGAVTVSHRVVGKREEAGPDYDPPTYSSDNPVSSKNVTVTVAGSTVSKLETARLVVANRLILGPAGSDGCMVGCLAGRRVITVSLGGWAEGDAWLGYVRNQASVAVAVTIACPGTTAWTITMNAMKAVRCVEEGGTDEAVRYVLELGATKPAGGDAIVLTAT